MLFVSLSQEKLLQSVPKEVDGIELRLDLFSKWDPASVREILSESTFPVLLTLRKASHGGGFLGEEWERERKLLELLELKPHFMDLEWDMRTEFLNKAFRDHHETRFILSYHNFQKTPEDLEGILSAMKVYPAWQYKIATMALSANDALRLLLFSKKHDRVSAMAMGDRGAFARVLSPVMGNQLHYGTVGNEPTAPGQFSVADLLNVYCFHSLNEKTALYGLIGSPVEKSSGDLYHNAAFRKRGVSAVYVKIRVEVEELEVFFSMAREIGFQGLSVTMPLKRAVMAFLDEIEKKAQDMGAVNTLVFRGGKILGTNTDGAGALNAVEKRGTIQNKRVVLLGAGGAARAIAFEAKLRGAEVWILNRTVNKALQLADELGCKGGGVTDFPSHYDVLINCASELESLVFSNILVDCLVMDVVYAPKETSFLKEAARLGCEVIYGEEMFVNQAAEQTAHWLDDGKFLSFCLV